MLIKKKPYQFWNYRDTRKQKFPAIKAPELPIVQTDKPTVIEGLISHHILLPRKELPQALLDRLRLDLTLRNPHFDQARKYGKGFVSYAIPEYVHLYLMDTQHIGLPRSIRMDYLHRRFKECGLKLVLKDVRPSFAGVTFPEKGIIKPWFFQHEAINRILSGNIVLKFRCGKGKTSLALMAVAKIRKRTLILVRTNILLKQWVEAIQNIFNVPEDEIGIINGKVKREGLITVATEQSLVDLPRAEKRRLGTIYGHAIFDECLGYDTRIKTKKGLRYIGDIVKAAKCGEKVDVLTYNEKTKKKEFKPVIKGIQQGMREVIEVHFDNRVIRCTPDHLFFVKDKGWTKAANLVENDDILE